MFIDNFQRPIYYIDLPKYTLILYTWVIIYWIIKEKASSFPHILNLNYLAGRYSISLNSPKPPTLGTSCDSFTVITPSSKAPFPETKTSP